MIWEERSISITALRFYEILTERAGFVSAGAVFQSPADKLFSY